MPRASSCSCWSGSTGSRCPGCSSCRRRTRARPTATRSATRGTSSAPTSCSTPSGSPTPSIPPTRTGTWTAAVTSTTTISSSPSPASSDTSGPTRAPPRPSTSGSRPTRSSMSGRALTDGYDTAGSPPTPDGDVFSNGMVSVHDHAKIEGDATGAGFDVARDAAVSGSRTIGTPLSFMEIKVPAGIPDLGKLTVEPGSPEVADRAPHRSKGGKGTKRSGGPKGRRQRTLVGPGSFLVSDLTIAGRSTLFVDNSAGPVTLYVTGRVTVKGTGRIVVADPNPEKFAIYVASNKPVSFGGSA